LLAAALHLQIAATRYTGMQADSRSVKLIDD